MPTRNGEEMGDAPSGKVLCTEENKNSNTDFNIHVDDKNVAATGAPSDHDVRYTSILEAIAKSGITIREAINLEVVSSGKAIADKLNQLADQSDNSPTSFQSSRLPSTQASRAATIASSCKKKSWTSSKRKSPENLNIYRKLPQRSDLAPQAASLEQPLLPVWVDLLNPSFKARRPFEARSVFFVGNFTPCRPPLSKEL